MRLDLEGKIANTTLPRSRPLLPLFEAIINSIQAKAGRVEIHLERDDTQVEVALGDGSHQPCVAFRVVDDGVGFTDENFKSFETSDSTLKKRLGGKGVGRFTWLKAFDRVEVDSVFHEATWRQRRFVFAVDEGGIGEASVREDDVAPGRRTEVVLRGYREPYRAAAPKRSMTIASHVVQHCLSYFMDDGCPLIEIHDGDEVIELNRHFKEKYGADREESLVQIGGHEFRLRHLKLYREATQHRIHYCADLREVETDNLAQHLPNLQGRIQDGDGQPFCWSTYVSGNYLDQGVTTERAGFSFPQRPPAQLDMDQPAELSLQEIRDAIVADLRKRLAGYLAPIQQEKRESVEKYIRETAPHYRPILKYAPGELEDLPPGLSDSALDQELHRIAYNLEAKVRDRSRMFLGGDGEVDATAPEYQQFLEEANDIGKSSLAKYVSHRRLILDLLSRRLERSAGKYELEEQVHRLIFPLRSTSDEIHYEQQNLWIIDEKLAYHGYLASDKELRAMEVVDSDSQKRPDLIIFNSPFAFAEKQQPFSSIVIIEFKRPGRVDYHGDRNPITQVYEYIKKIRDGRAKDRVGRPIGIPDALPFYCYIVCDLTPTLMDQAREASLVQAPDARGFFGFNQYYNAYVEVISYEKLVGDAVARNRILFEKLNLPIR